MWDQYLSDLYWASKAAFGVACPVCGGVMTFVRSNLTRTAVGRSSTLSKMSGMRSDGVLDR